MGTLQQGQIRTNKDKRLLLPETAAKTTKPKATASTDFIFSSDLDKAPVVINSIISFTINSVT